MPNGLSQTAYAKRLKLSRGRIGQLVDEGLPVGADGRIDPVAADRWIAGHIDPERQEAEKRGRVAPVSTAMADVRRQKMSADAQLAELEIGKRTGALVARDVVEGFVFARARSDRDAWISWIARTAPELAAQLDVDPQKAFTFLDRVTREHLLELAGTKADRL